MDFFDSRASIEKTITNHFSLAKMPKVAQETKSPRHSRRHNPLAEEYAPTEPFKLKAEKKRKHAEDKPGENDYVESKSSQRILQIGQDLVEEDQTERKKAEPNPAFAIESRSAPGAQEEDDRAAFEDEDEDEDDAWGDEEELAEEVVRRKVRDSQWKRC